MNPALPVSIFNDVIGPVMRGPSSSHCAAALRIGRLARDLMDGDFNDILIEFDRGGSLPTTHESQGSDMGLFGGLLGWEANDERLPNSRQALLDSGVRVRFETVDTRDPHPNTYRLTLRNAREQHTLVALSTGGGMIEVIRVDEFDLSLFGDGYETLIWIEDGAEACAVALRRALPRANVNIHTGTGEHLVEVKADRFLSEDEIVDRQASTSLRQIRRLHPVLPVLSHPGMQLPFTSVAEMLRHDAERGTPLAQLGLDYEMARSRMDPDALSRQMRALIALLKESIAQGTAGTRHEDRILGPQTAQFQQCLQGGKLLDGGLLNRMVLYVSALMEVKSSMGVIVAAPTAGACAAFPGSVIAAAEAMELPDDKLVEAFFAAGLIGVFIATRWTFAAEVGGCQAEGGAAAAMAAAGLVSLKDGSLAQSLAAASMALQNMLGLICDPVANRVEVPCLGKNVLAASNALSCANLALAGYDPVIPLDEVIDAARAVSAQMPRELRCTGLGGLATTPTSLALQEKLASLKANPTGCTTCSCD